MHVPGGFRSDFEEDVLAPEEPVGEEAGRHYGYGEGEGGHVGAAVAGEDVMVGPEPCGDGFAGGGEAVGDLDPEHDLDNQVGDDEGGDGVRAEDEPGPEEGLACG